MPGYQPRRPTNPLVVVFVLIVGLVLSVAGGLLIYDHFEKVRDRDRLGEINQQLREDRVLHKLSDIETTRLEMERRSILNRHPEWRE